MAVSAKAIGHKSLPDLQITWVALARRLLFLPAVLIAQVTWAGVPLPTPTPTATAGPTATLTPTFISRLCTLGSGSSVTISARLVVLTLPLRGYQTWQFGYLKPDNSRDMLVRASGSHFDCGSTIFSGVGARVCARLDPGSVASGVINCAGSFFGHDTLVQIDHDTNMSTVHGMPNVGLPLTCVGGSHDGLTCSYDDDCPGGTCEPATGSTDPDCVATFVARDGSVSSACLEGTDDACSGAGNAHAGVCNSPLQETFSGAAPAGGFLLRQSIDLSLTFSADCSALTCHCGIGTCSGGPTPGAHCGADSECGGGTCDVANGAACTTNASCTGSISPGVCAVCPPDTCPLQAGEIQISGDMTSGQSKGVLWNVNDRELVMGTIGTGNGANICGTASGGPECLTSATGHPLPNCVAAVPSSAQLTGAAAAIAYPAIDLDQTIGDMMLTLRLQCGEPTNTPTPTTTPTDTPTPTLTPTPTWTPAAACASAPRPGCQQPQRSSGVSLNTVSHTARWKWVGGSAAVALAQFGDPVQGATAYHLCVYDTNGGAVTLAFAATVPAGGTCGTKPCWKQVRNHYSYLNAAGAPDGVRRMLLQPSGLRSAQIVVRGRGANLHLPVAASGVLLQEQPQVIVQLQRSDHPGCWEAVFAAPPVRDTPRGFTDTVH